MKQRVCCQCGSGGRLANLYGYDFCGRCQSKLKLHADKTILKNADLHGLSKPDSYEDEVINRLLNMENDFVKNKVKLLHILARLGELT